MLPIARIQISRRLVGQHNRRFQDKGAGKRHTLLLASRELHRIVMKSIRQSNGLQKSSGVFFAVPIRIQFIRKQDIFECR